MSTLLPFGARPRLRCCFRRPLPCCRTDCVRCLLDSAWRLCATSLMPMNDSARARALSRLTAARAHALAGTELIERCIGSKIWILMRGDKVPSSSRSAP